MLFLSWYLWVVPHILAGVCLIGLVRRRHARPLTMFFGYLIVQVVAFICLLALQLLRFRFPSAVSWYERINIADLAASGLVTLLVIYQLTDELILSQVSFRETMHSLMRWTLAVLLLVAVSVSALFKNGGFPTTWKIFQAVDFSVNLMKVGLLLAVLLFSHALRISWRSLPAGIVLGFGVYGTVALCAAVLLSAFGHAKNLVLLDAVSMGAFHVSVLIWLVYIFLPAGPPAFTGQRPERTELEAWDQEMRKIVP